MNRLGSSRKESQDDDDFWSSSQAKSNKINLFDDDLTVEAANDLAKTKTFLNADVPDLEETDTIEWDGTPSSQAAVHFSASSSSLGSKQLPSQSQQHSQVQQVANMGRSVSFSSAEGASGVAIATSRPSTTTRDSISQNLVYGDKTSTTSMSVEQKKMTEEIRYLQRTLDRAKVSGGVRISVEDAIRFMLMDEPCVLEGFKAMSEKLQLLDKAIEVGDGNIIIKVVLFLQKSLKPQLFKQEIQKRPVAANHYINYLKEHWNIQEMIDFLGFLGRNEDAAMVKYQHSLTSSADKTVKNLVMCKRAHFDNDMFLKDEAQYIQQHISLLERQLPIEAADKRDEEEGKIAMFKQYPRKSSILNMSVITTLYYCCFYHGQLAENSLASPVAIQKAHNLTDKQFLWTCLSARSRLQQWLGVEQLLTAKGWFGTKTKSAIGFHRVCEVLHQTNAPLDILSKYLRLIDDTEKRLTLAKRMNCHDVVVDTLVATRDRRELMQYASKLTPHTKEDYYARDALKNSTIKWKN